MLSIIILLIPLGSGIWVGYDADKRGMNPWGWGIGTFLLLIIILPLYLLTRQPIQDRSSSYLDDDIIDLI